MNRSRGDDATKRRRQPLSREVIAALLARAARNLRDPERQRRQRAYLRQMYEADVLAEERGDYPEVFDLRAMERQTICAALKTATSKAEAARLLGIDRSTLNRSVKRHDIEMPDHWRPDTQPLRPRKMGRLRGTAGPSRRGAPDPERASDHGSRPRWLDRPHVT